MVLSQLWVSARTNSSLSLSVQALQFLLLHCYNWPCSIYPECHYESQLQGHLLAWFSLQKSCSEELSLLVAGRALGTIPLLSSVPSPSVSRHGLLHCVQEKTGEDPTASQIRKHKAFPAVSCTLRTFPNGLWKETLTPLPLMGSLLSFMGQGSKLHCPHVNFLKLFYFPS